MDLGRLLRSRSEHEVFRSSLEVLVKDGVEAHLGVQQVHNYGIGHQEKHLTVEPQGGHRRWSINT